MKSPFPGMDPYLEHPALWPDVHNSLIAAIRDAITPMVAPRYYVGLERRAYKITPEDVVVVGRPDIAIIPRPHFEITAPIGMATEPGTAVLDVELPIAERIEESYLEVREVRTGILVTVIEVLSPTNKVFPDGRRQYLEKRDEILATRTSLVEIDLLRAGEPLAPMPPGSRSDYRVLVARGWKRPNAKVYAFGLRAAIPTFPLPLFREDDEPPVDLNATLHALYGRARFDLRLDYAAPPVPPLGEADAAWARGLTPG